MERRNASTLLDRVLEAGRADEIALITDEGMVSYGELGRMVAAVGSYLNGLGVQREQRVLMVLDDSAAFHATFLGAMRIGAVPVPVNPMDRIDNHVYYLEDSYAKVLVIEAALMPNLEAMLAARPDIQVVVVGGEVGRHTQFDYIVADGDDLRAPADTHQDDMAFWLYSSGSTGRPKGVVHSHRDIGVTADTYARNVLRIGSDDVCYSTTKLFHAYGLGNSLSFPMSVGASSVLVRGRSAPGRIFEVIEHRHPTLFFSVPALYAAMVRAPGASDTDFSSVRACVSAAEPLPAAVFSRWHEVTGVPILDGIGSTEMLHIYCSNSMDDLHPGTSGRPVPGYSLRIVDERGVDVAPGVAGDMMVRGESCASFYWHQREKTRHCMRGEWFYTGDRYVENEDGCFVYQGRADDMIKVGGLWVSPADVEACLVRHPAVSEAAVIGVQIDDVSRIKAFVICPDAVADQVALTEELRAWCKEHLRRYEYPHVVAFVDDFPRTATGKIQRFKLREAEAVAAAAEIAAVSSVREQLAGSMADVRASNDVPAGSA
ncbi:MAG TPA: benzoate-CoA ligase family protein [Solirubrobacteraceae bacterium]|nr:benzoate-CoA ligase family protein [Solirubrobacteraceae bacterium]